MPASQKQINANRANSRLSRGPTSVFGKSRSRWNALKHGMASRQNTIDGENASELEQELDAWVDDLEPEGPTETALVHNAVLAQWKVARATRFQNSRLSSQIENAQKEEDKKIRGLFDRLLHNPQRPTEIYGASAYDSQEPRISWSPKPEPGGNPADLVEEICATASGCTLLKTEWQALRSRLEPGKMWDNHDMFKCIRMLGRQPIHALDVREVSVVFVACSVIDEGRHDPYAPLKCELDHDEYRTFAQRMRGRWTDLPRPGDPKGARGALLSIIDRVIGELDGKLAEFEQNKERNASRRIDALSFDDSPVAARVRAYELSCAARFFGL